MCKLAMTPASVIATGVTAPLTGGTGTLPSESTSPAASGRSKVVAVNVVAPGATVTVAEHVRPLVVVPLQFEAPGATATTTLVVFVDGYATSIRIDCVLGETYDGTRRIDDAAPATCGGTAMLTA
jgi:hypothetical protein